VGQTKFITIFHIIFSQVAVIKGKRSFSREQFAKIMLVQLSLPLHCAAHHACEANSQQLCKATVKLKLMSVLVQTPIKLLPEITYRYKLPRF
jgi:hypothetical protein